MRANSADDYERQLLTMTLRLDSPPEPFTIHLPDCPYACDEMGQLWKPDAEALGLNRVEWIVADECSYCVGPREEA